MKTLGTILLTASALALLAAVWAPGAWWQWLITAIVLLFAGAACAGNVAKRAAEEELHHVEQQAAEASARAAASRTHLDQAVEQERARLGLKPRPTYGRKDDQ